MHTPMRKTPNLALLIIVFGISNVHAYATWGSEIIAAVLLIVLLLIVVTLLYKYNRDKKKGAPYDNNMDMAEEGVLDATMHIGSQAYHRVREAVAHSNHNESNTANTLYAADYIADTSAPHAHSDMHHHIEDTTTYIVSDTTADIDMPSTDWDVSVSDSIDVDSSFDFDLPDTDW